MCTDPNHVQSPNHDLIHQIAENLGEVKGTVDKLESALYGEGTTKGLITKVDEIRTGHIEGGQKAAAVTSGFIATTISIIAGVIAAVTGRA